MIFWWENASRKRRVTLSVVTTLRSKTFPVDSRIVSNGFASEDYLQLDKTWWGITQHNLTLFLLNIAFCHETRGIIYTQRENKINWTRQKSFLLWLWLWFFLLQFSVYRVLTAGVNIPQLNNSDTIASDKTSYLR